MNKAAPMAACKGNQRIPSCGIINGISANAPAGAKYFPFEDGKQTTDNRQGDNCFGQMQIRVSDDLKGSTQTGSGHQKQKHLHGTVSEARFRIDNLGKGDNQRRNNEISISAEKRKGSDQRNKK